MKALLDRDSSDQFARQNFDQNAKHHCKHFMCKLSLMTIFFVYIAVFNQSNISCN